MGRYGLRLRTAVALHLLAIVVEVVGDKASSRIASCCSRYYDKEISKAHFCQFKDYTLTEKCFKKDGAVLFFRKSSSPLCADPQKNWVKQLLQFLDRKVKCKKRPKNPSVSRRVDSPTHKNSRSTERTHGSSRTTTTTTTRSPNPPSTDLPNMADQSMTLSSTDHTNMALLYVDPFTTDLPNMVIHTTDRSSDLPDMAVHAMDLFANELPNTADNSTHGSTTDTPNIAIHSTHPSSTDSIYPSTADTANLAIHSMNPSPTDLPKMAKQPIHRPTTELPNMAIHSTHSSLTDLPNMAKQPILPTTDLPKMAKQLIHHPTSELPNMAIHSTHFSLTDHPNIVKLPIPLPTTDLPNVAIHSMNSSLTDLPNMAKQPILPTTELPNMAIHSTHFSLTDLPNMAKQPIHLPTTDIPNVAIHSSYPSTTDPPNRNLRNGPAEEEKRRPAVLPETVTGRLDLTTAVPRESEGSGHGWNTSGRRVPYHSHLRGEELGDEESTSTRTQGGVTMVIVLTIGMAATVLLVYSLCRRKGHREDVSVSTEIISLV